MEMLIPIFAIVFSIGGPVVILLMIIMNRHNLALAKYRRIQQAIDSGKSPDEVERMIEIIEKVHAKPPRQKYGFLRGGVVVVGAGLAAAVVGAIIGVTECLAASGGAIVLGLSLIAAWYLVDRKQRTAKTIDHRS